MSTYITIIDENECIGDSLTTINTNFSAIDNVSDITKQNFNTLIRTLTSFAQSPATTYTSLSTQFRALSSLIIT